MTLILSLGNPDQFIQLSDRRLTSNDNTPPDDESNKAGSLICANARLIFGFCGLAENRNFKTRQYILDTLLHCGPPDYLLGNILKRLRDQLTKDFNSSSLIKNIPASEKRLSIIFSGYLNSITPPLAICAIISNYQDLPNNKTYPQAMNRFLINKTSERRPLDKPFTFVKGIGIWYAVSKADEIALRQLLEAQIPSKGIIGKGVELMREMADRPIALGGIGKQITSICLPRDPSSAIELGYHTNVVTYSSNLPSQVVIISDNERYAMMDPALNIEELDGTPVAIVPKVHPSAVCPCNSGKKYRDCHGK